MAQVHNPFVTSPPAPGGAGASPPSSAPAPSAPAAPAAPVHIHIHPPVPARPRTLRVVQRSFRRTFLDRQDPFESAGLLHPRFTYNGSYDLSGKRPQDVADEIRDEIHARLAAGNLSAARVEVLDLDDAGMRNEAPRRFVVASTDTARRTLVTVNAYFQPCGQHLYYSVRSYLLPPLSVWKLLLAVLFSLATLFTASLWVTGGGFAAGGVALAVASAILAFGFRRLIRDLLAGDAPLTALRKQFPRRFDGGTFDVDDVAAFLKTNLDLTLGTIARVLEKHGIETGGLRAVVQNLQTINVTAGGSIVGAVIGGAHNHAVGSTGP